MNAVSSLEKKGYSWKPVETVLSPPPGNRRVKQRRHILPGFHLTLGFTLFYLSAIVLLPLGALLLKTVTPTKDYPTVYEVVGHVFKVATDTRSLDSYRLSFGISFAAALLNGVFGFIAAWTLTRYQFHGKKIIDALVDLPFAMPTSVAGLALTQVFSTHGGYNRPASFYLVRLAYRLHVVGDPDRPDFHRISLCGAHAAAGHGRTGGGGRGSGGLPRRQSMADLSPRHFFPALSPALLTGIMLAFGRGVGEYGSIVFISSMIPYLTEITPQLIIIKLEENDYVGAAGLGMVMLLMSFAIVATVNSIQYVAARRRRA